MLTEISGVDFDSCLVSTAEHLALFNHATTISFLLPQLLAAVGGLVEPKPILVLGGSLIPLDNADYPRGFLLPGNTSPAPRVNLWSQRRRKAVPLLLPPVEVGPQVQALGVNFPYLAQALIASSGTNYAMQLASAMEAISSRWLPNAAHPPVRVKSLESVAADFLAALIHQRDPLLMRLFEDAQARAWLWRTLHGIACAWDDSHGTFLLWSALADGTLLPLREQDGCLLGDGVSVPFVPDAVAAGLTNRQLLPSVPLALLAISWLPGIPVAGGPKQVFYWRHMITAFNQVLRPMQERPATLSQYGYGQIYLDDALSNMGIPLFGTGLALADLEFDIESAMRLIAACPEMPPRDLRYGS